MSTIFQRPHRAPVSLACTLLALAAAPAAAGSLVSTFVNLSQTAVENTGFDLVPHRWPVDVTSEQLVDVNKPLVTELKNTSKGLGAKLVIEQTGLASGQYVRGVGLGGATLLAPVLKAETAWLFSAEGVGLGGGDGATWDRLGSRHWVDVSATFNLSPLGSTAQAPSTFEFWWRITGDVNHFLAAPARGSTNPFPFTDPDIYRASVSFGGSAGVNWTTTETRVPIPGFLPDEVGLGGYYGVSRPIDVYLPVRIEAGAIADGPVSFGMSLDNEFQLGNGDFANEYFVGELRSLLGQSATLLGVMALDDQGGVVPGYGLLADDGLGQPFALQMLASAPGPALPPVPESSTWAMLALGLCALVPAVRRRRGG